MNDYDVRGRLIAHTFFSELEKIAFASDIPTPADIAERVNTTNALRQQADPDLLQKLRPGTGSFFQALKDKAQNQWRKHMLKSEGQTALDNLRPSLGKGLNFEDEARALRQMGEIRAAEKALHGSGGKSPFDYFRRTAADAASSSPRPLRNLAFGVGLGAAGLLAGQHYLRKRREQQEMGY
jgi:hypothetical protein